MEVTAEEFYLCDIDGCKNKCTHLVSHSTYIRRENEYPTASFVGVYVCESHVDEGANELIKEYGEPNGDNIEVTVTDFPMGLDVYPCMHTECFNEAVFSVDMDGGGTALCHEHLWAVLDNKEKYGYLGQTKLIELGEK